MSYITMFAGQAGNIIIFLTGVVPPFTPSLDFSDARNSQYIVITGLC